LTEKALSHAKISSRSLGWNPPFALFFRPLLLIPAFFRGASHYSKTDEMFYNAMSSLHGEVIFTPLPIFL